MDMRMLKELRTLAMVKGHSDDSWVQLGPQLVDVVGDQQLPAISASNTPLRRGSPKDLKECCMHSKDQAAEIEAPFWMIAHLHAPCHG